MKQQALWIGAVLLAALMFSNPLYAVTIGQVDDFEDGTTQNWVINLLGMGSPPPSTLPKNVSTGGPGGAGDSYLQLTSSGNPGAGGRLVGIQFQNQWAGNYIDAGVNAITMDVINLGPNDLSLRLLFADPVNAPPTNQAISTTPVLLPVGAGWQSVMFLIDPGSLTAQFGTVEAALTAATELRILHAPDLTGPAIVAASVGIDNITAAAIPEPATVLLIGAGLAALVLRRPGRRA